MISVLITLSRTHTVHFSMYKSFSLSLFSDNHFSITQTFLFVNTFFKFFQKIFLMCFLKLFFAVLSCDSLVILTHHFLFVNTFFTFFSNFFYIWYFYTYIWHFSHSHTDFLHNTTKKLLLNQATTLLYVTYINNIDKPPITNDNTIIPAITMHIVLTIFLLIITIIPSLYYFIFLKLLE